MSSPSQEILASTAADSNCRSCPPPAPTREQLRLAMLEMVHKGPIHKADVFRVDLGHGTLAIKDYSGKPWWTRLIGVVQIAHECAAYRVLGHFPGIPRFIGRIDALGLAMEWIEGIELVERDDRFSAGRAHLHSLRLILDQFLAKGFFHFDVRARRNVMITQQGQVMIFDMAGAWWVRPGTLRHRLLAGLLRYHYWVVLLKWKKLLTWGRSDRCEKLLAKRVWYRLRMPHRWFSRLLLHGTFRTKRSGRWK